MKKLLLILSVPLLFNSCTKEEIENFGSPESGTVKLEATCQSTPFRVYYYHSGNTVETTSNTPYWSAEFESEENKGCRFRLTNISSDSLMTCFFSIKWNGTILSSYEGEIEDSKEISADFN